MRRPRAREDRPSTPTPSPPPVQARGQQIKDDRSRQLGSAVTGNDHLGREFATTWPTFELDDKTRALLAYAKKLTESPAQLDDGDVQHLRALGWDERGIYEATALVAFFNFSGRMEAASGLPLDEVPADSPMDEARS